MHRHHRLFTVGLLSLALLAACSTTPNANTALTNAQRDYDLARSSSDAPVLAPAEMGAALADLKRARQAQERDAPQAEVSHLAYLAAQRVAMAREKASQRQAEQAMESMAADRDRMRLQARTAEADAARGQLTLAQRQASASNQRADDADERSSDLDAQLRALQAQRTSRGMVVTIGDVLFDVDRAEIKPGGAHQLDQLGALLLRYPTQKALIEGHTDSTGSSAHNQRLSQQRADAVRAHLLGMGIASDRVESRGAGEAAPVASNASQDGRQRNRRVEIILPEGRDRAATR